MIYNQGQRHRRALAFKINVSEKTLDIPAKYLRKTALHLPEMSELDTIRHYTQLSQKNFSIDTNFYPLGSCSMKYNPRVAHQLAMDSGFLNLHPYASESSAQGVLHSLYELQEILLAATGMESISLAPMAGAQGELAGVMMIRKFHRAQGDFERDEMLVPDAAHGTNPASAKQCGFKVKEVPTTPSGDVDLDALEKMLGPRTAGIMLTNPSTLGVFEREVKKISAMVHKAGGLLYYDGANLNAILGRFRPGDMGFDVMHLNLHKTFATPHGGGGPGAGPVAVGSRLKKFLPLGQVVKENASYRFVTQNDLPESIGRLSAFHGNAGVLIRAFVYARMLGRHGLKRVGDFATLNANYLMCKLQNLGYTLAFPARRATHEFLITVKSLQQTYGVSALDIAKRLLDYGFHAPTIYFPLLVPECLLIEPTETESRQTLDNFIEVMAKIVQEIKQQPAILHSSPTQTPVGRLDEVRAARELNVIHIHLSADVPLPTGV